MSYFYLCIHELLFVCCRECLDPFDEPECEALDLFVNEILCIGKGINFFTISFFWEELET